jgi:hypothetical protein
VISIVLPAHNESEYLAEAVRGVVSGMRQRPRPFEVLIVENGSTDRTEAAARKLARDHAEVHVLVLTEPDYGRALRRGFLAASGDVVVNFDVDWCDLAFLDAALSILESASGPALIVGSKRCVGAADTRHWPRRLVTFAFSSALKVGFGLTVSDTHGVKAMRREPLVDIARGCRFGKDLFDTELILRAERAGLRCSEIPVQVVELRPPRSSILRRLPRSILGLVQLRIALWSDPDMTGSTHSATGGDMAEAVASGQADGSERPVSGI